MDPDNLSVDVPEKKAWSSLHGAWGKRPVKQTQYNSGTVSIAYLLTVILCQKPVTPVAIVCLLL